MSDRVEKMFEPNPEKPWLMKIEGDIVHDGTLVSAYTVPPEHRTKKPPKDTWARHVYRICKCGHLGGDHRPGCIVEGCECQEFSPTDEWEKLRTQRYIHGRGTIFVWEEWPVSREGK